jgi:hypothetical protein
MKPEKPRLKRWLARLLPVCLLCWLCFGLAQYHVNEAQLLRKAKLFSSRFDPSHTWYVYNSAFWRSNCELVVWTVDNNDDITPELVSNHYPTRRLPFVYSEGKAPPFVATNYYQVNKELRGYIGPWLTTSLSFDGQWLLFQNSHGASGQWNAYHFSDGRCLHWSARDNPKLPLLATPVWLPNNHQWVTITALPHHSLQLQIYDVSMPTWKREVPIQGMVGNMVLGITNQNRLLTVTRHVWQRPFICFPISGQPDHSISFDEISLSEGSTYHHALALPSETRIVEVVLSPQGDRLAWLLYAVRHPWPAWLPQRFPWLHADLQHSMGVWVSNLDGSAMHEIGEVILEKGGTKQTPPPQEPMILRWLPDGKRISFFYKEGLFTVAAD